MSPSPSFCSYFNEGRCRSCEWISQDYASQLSAKERVLLDALKSFYFFTLEPTVQSPLQGFRNRAKMSVTGTVAEPVIGLLGEETLDEGREILACPIHHPKINELMTAMPDWIRRYELVPYRIRERKGELKGLIAFYSPQTDQMYLRFVLRSKESFARLRGMLPEFQKAFPHVTCLSANIQPIPHAILEGPEEVILSKQDHIEHQLGELKLKLAPQAFVQTNAQVATELYTIAARWIAEAGVSRAADLFCGQGAFSFFAAESAAQFLGIELNADAVRVANETAEKLGLSHLSFKCADARQVGAELANFRPDLVLVNPPRRGLSEGVQMILEQRPSQLIYSSCAVETLALDLEKLAGFYRLKRIQIFDMFPHTRHFETLVWLVDPLNLIAP